MRTNIDIDDELMTRTMQVTGKTTKKDAVEEAMRRAVRNAELADALDSLRGIGWGGNLDEMRRDRAFAEDGTVIHEDE